MPAFGPAVAGKVEALRDAPTPACTIEGRRGGIRGAVDEEDQVSVLFMHKRLQDHVTSILLIVQRIMCWLWVSIVIILLETVMVQYLAMVSGVQIQILDIHLRKHERFKGNKC